MPYHINRPRTDGRYRAVHKLQAESSRVILTILTLVDDIEAELMEWTAQKENSPKAHSSTNSCRVRHRRQTLCLSTTSLICGNYPQDLMT